MENDDVPEPTAREVLIALNAHVSACGTLQKINMGFMGAVLSVLVIFAGYTYVHDQADSQQLLLARIAATQASNAVQQIPQKTADAVTAKVAAQQGN
jgi:hypothetical protein